MSGGSSSKSYLLINWNADEVLEWTITIFLYMQWIETKSMFNQIENNLMFKLEI